MAYQELVEKLRNAHAVNVTPFRDDRSIDYEGPEENIQYAINATFATIAQSVDHPVARVCGAAEPSGRSLLSDRFVRTGMPFSSRTQKPNGLHNSPLEER